MSDQCLQSNPLEKTAQTKEATGISVFLLEELGDARLRCAQLRKQIDDAMSLVEKSEHKDHLFEIAGHLIQSIPDTLLRMDKALSAAAMAAAKLDYEEIKDDLRPEKVEELERALDEVRVRRLKRRSNKEARSQNITSKAVDAFRDVLLPLLQFETKEALDQAVADAMIELARMRAGNGSGLISKLDRYKPDESVDGSDWADQIEEAMEDWFSSMKRMLSLKLASEASMKTTEAAARLELLAAETEATGKVDTTKLMTLIAALEAGVRTASSGSELSEVLRSLSANLLSANEAPSRRHLAATLRRVLGDAMNVVAAEEQTASGGRDPYWMTARYRGKAQDGTPIKPGDRVFYFPNDRTMLVGEAAEAAARRYHAEVQDEDLYSYGRRS